MLVSNEDDDAPFFGVLLNTALTAISLCPPEMLSPLGQRKYSIIIIK